MSLSKLLISLYFVPSVYCFQPHNPINLPSTKAFDIHQSLRLSRNDDQESIKINNNNKPSIDSNLVRPPINVRKESILFGDNPATAENNKISRLWKVCKMNLPYVLTGVSKNDPSSPVDNNPVGAIYNMVFVRFPSALAGVLYTKNLIQGHPLYCDVGFGAGPFEIPPLFVYAILLIILR